MIGASILALAATVVVGVLLGAERVDGADSLFDADALPQLFVAFRIGLVYGALSRCCSGSPSPSCRCRSAPARWRSPASPPPGSGPGSAAS